MKYWAPEFERGVIGPQGSEWISRRGQTVQRVGFRSILRWCLALTQVTHVEEEEAG